MSKNASNIKVTPCSSSKVNAALKHKALKQYSVCTFFVCVHSHGEIKKMATKDETLINYSISKKAA